MTNGDDFRFMVKELSEMRESLSNKIDDVNDNVSEVKADVAELRGTSIARMDTHDKCIEDLQKDRNEVWEKLNESNKTLAIHEYRMNKAEIPVTPEEFEKAMEKSKPYLDKLLKLRFKNMTVKEKLATTGIGGGTALGLVYAIFEYGPAIFKALINIFG